MTHQSTELDRVRRLDQIEQKNTEAQSIRKTLEFIDITEYWEDTSASATTYNFLVSRANARELESAEIQYDLDPQDWPDPTNEPDKFPETTQEQALGWMIEHGIRDPARRHSPGDPQPPTVRRNRRSPHTGPGISEMHLDAGRSPRGQGWNRTPCPGPKPLLEKTRPELGQDRRGR